MQETQDAENKGFTEERPELAEAVRRVSELTFAMIEHRTGKECDDHGEACLQPTESMAKEITDLDLLQKMVAIMASAVANNYIGERLAQQAALRMVIGALGGSVHRHGGDECKNMSEQAEGGNDNAAETAGA